MKESPPRRVILAVDLALKGKSYARAFDEQGKPLGGRRRFEHNLSGYQSVRELLPTPGEGEHLEVRFVYESTSAAWKPFASWIEGQEWPERVSVSQYRVKPQDVAALRKALRRTAKTDRIDTQVLAKLAMLQAESLVPLSPSDHWVLERLAKRHFRFRELVIEYKARIWGLGLTILPGIWDVLGGTELTQVARVVLRDLLKPRGLVALDVEGITKYLAAQRVKLAPRKIEELVRRAEEAVTLYEQEGSYLDVEMTHQELVEALEMLELFEERKRPLEARMKELLDKRFDPEGALRSIDGVGDVVAAYVVAAVGNVDRFPSIDKFVGYTGYFPVVVQSVKAPRGVRLAKTGPKLLKVALYLAAEIARRFDPEMADLYERQFVQRAKEHKTALCHVATALARRLYAVMKRMRGKQLGEVCRKDIGYEWRDPRRVDRVALSKREARCIATQIGASVKEERKARKGRRKKAKAPAEATCDGQLKASKVVGKRTPSPVTLAPMAMDLRALVDGLRRSRDEGIGLTLAEFAGPLDPKTGVPRK